MKDVPISKGAKIGASCDGNKGAVMERPSGLVDKAEILVFSKSICPGANC